MGEFTSQYSLSGNLIVNGQPGALALSPTTGLTANLDVAQFFKGAKGNSSSASFLFTQSSPSTTWIINHNFGLKPAVSVFTTGGAQMEVDIVHVSLNQAIAYLKTAMSGSATCS